MQTAPAALPDDIDALKAALLAARVELAQVRAEAAVAAADLTALTALIAHQKLMIEKLKRDKFGPSSERTARLIDQMEFELEEMEAAATEDELAAERAVRTTEVAGFTRNKPVRRAFPDHLPRERVVIPGPVACACCGGTRLSKLGEDVTETLEVIPRQWKVIQHVREKFTCRDCEKISQPPAPFHPTPRGWAGPNLLAMILDDPVREIRPAPAAEPPGRAVCA
jgi:transposase